jgi:membrane-bound lytic murein transglycosylase MltF
MAGTAQDIMGRYGIDQDFAASIESLGNDLGVDPMYLANVMYSESQLDPSKKNKAGSKATGLIQFMPTTASKPRDYD